MPKNISRMGYLFCSLSMAGSLLHGRPVFLRRPALWQQREGIRRIFDTPSTSSSARGTQTGRYWRFDHVIL